MEIVVEAAAQVSLIAPSLVLQARGIRPRPFFRCWQAR